MQDKKNETQIVRNLISADMIGVFNKFDKATALFSEQGSPVFFNQLFADYFPKAETNNDFFRNVLFYTQKITQQQFSFSGWVSAFKHSGSEQLQSEQLWLKPAYQSDFIPVVLDICQITLEDVPHILLTIHDNSLKREFYAHNRLADEHFAGQFITNSSGQITHPNAAFCKYTSLSKDVLIKLNYISWLKKQVSFEMPFDVVMSTLLHTHHWSGAVKIFNEEKATFSAILNLSMLVDPKNNLEHFIGVLQDLTEIEQAEEKIDKLSHFDPLTGLANRKRLNQYLKEKIERDNETFHCLFLLGLDGFEIINDTYGTKVGDALLIEVAQKIGQFIAGDTVLARLEGSHFAVLFDTNKNEISMAEYQVIKDAETLWKKVSGRYNLPGQSLHAACTIGMCVFPCNDESEIFSSEQIISFASMALFKAREDGGHYYLFDKGLKETAFNNLELIEALNHSELDSEFQVFFQGQANKDGEIVSAETLIRWQHPVLGMIPPSKFIPIAEKGRQIIKIGLWVLHKSFLQAVAWNKLKPSFRVAINISPVQFHEQSFIEIIIGLLKFTQVNPVNITLELTEGVLIKNSRLALQKISHLVSLGFEVSIDDFGTGYSSLSYLQKLPIHELKIDQSFIAHLEENPDDDAVVDSIIQLAMNKGLSIVAEGVETKEQVECLIDKCPTILLQGYYFSRPIPAEEFEETFLR